MSTRTVLIVLAVALAAAAGPAVAPAAAAPVTLTISVETPEGTAIGGAELTATWEGGSAERTTASNGKAFIDVPQGADVTIEVTHPDYVRNSPYRLTDAEEQEVPVTVYEKASATLTVVDGEGPVSDVRVELRKDGKVAATRFTDVQGEITSGVIEAGEYTVTLFKAGYFREAVPLTVEGDTTEQIEMERGSVSVEFLVLDENFDPPRPVAEATITGPDFTSATQNDGTRSVSVPVNTQFRVAVEKPGYRTVEQAVVVREQDKQVNVTTRKKAAILVSVPNDRVVVGETLRVTVTNQYEEPLPDAVVYLDGDAVGQPDAQGVIRVPIESAGDHSLYAEHDQLTSERLTITGVESGSGEVPSPDGSADETPDGDEPPTGGFLGVPGVGPLHLRSTAIGIAGGLVLSAVLFVFIRFR